jgi:hypothetical protein
MPLQRVLAREAHGAPGACIPLLRAVRERLAVPPHVGGGAALLGAPGEAAVRHWRAGAAVPEGTGREASASAGRIWLRLGGPGGTGGGGCGRRSRRFLPGVLNTEMGDGAGRSALPYSWLVASGRNGGCNAFVEATIAQGVRM